MTEVDFTMAVAGIPDAQIEFLDRVAGDHRDQPNRIADDHFDLRHQPIDLDVGDDRVEAIARAQMRGTGLTAQPVDLARRHNATITLSRSALIRPARRSQRRNVSTLIPRVLAASLAL